jgi:hypothetical protein
MGTILEKEEIKKNKEEQEKQLISLTLTGLLMEGTERREHACKAFPGL